MRTKACNSVLDTKLGCVGATLQNKEGRICNLLPLSLHPRGNLNVVEWKTR